MFIPVPSPFLVTFGFFTFCNAIYLSQFLSLWGSGSPPSLFPPPVDFPEPPSPYIPWFFTPSPPLSTNLSEINHPIFIFVVNSNNLKKHSRAPSVIEQDDIAAARNSLKATRPIEWVWQQTNLYLYHLATKIEALANSNLMTKIALS